MSSWLREHLDRQVVALVVKDGVRRFVTIKEPEGENRFPNDVDVTEIEQGRKLADDAVQREYPHECERPQCTDWREMAGSGDD